MKRFLLILCAGLALPGAIWSQGDLSKLDVSDLTAEVDKASAGAVAEAIRRLPAVTAEEDGGAQARLFIAACGAATEDELAQLRPIVSGMLGKNSSANYCFSAYTAAYFRTIVARAKREGTKLAMPPPDMKIPDALNGDEELRRLWVAWHTARDPYATIFDAAQAAIRAEKLPPPGPVEEILRKVLDGPKPELFREIVRQLQVEPLLVNVRENTLFPASRAMLLQTLPGKPTPETLGAAFRLYVGRLNTDNSAKPGSFREALCDLLTLAGLDWEEVFAGAMVPDNNLPALNARPPLILLDDMSTWQMLAARGSPRGVRLGLAVIRKTKMDSTRALDFITTALRASPVAPEPVTRFRDGRSLPFRAEPLAPEVRAGVIAAAGELLAPERSPAELTLVIRTLPRNLLPELLAPLQKLLHHSSYPIAQQTRALLVEAKLVDENVEITPMPPPLRVRVMIDGQPLASRRVQAVLPLSSTMQSTDADGWLKLPLQTELDLTKVRSVQIISDLTEAANANGEWEGPWFDTTVLINGQVDREFTATVETTSLEVDLDPTSEVPLSKPARLILSRAREGRRYQPIRLSLPIKDALTFQHLERATYYVEVLADGAARYQSKPIVLGKNGSIRLVRLEPGRDVRVKFESSDSITHLSRCRLFRNGEAIAVTPNSGYTGWDGLPFGKYELRLDPWPQKGAALLLGVQGIPEKGYEGITHEFELKADSPMQVDLGIFQLKAVK